MHARPLTRHTLRRLAVVGAAGVVLAAATATGPVSAAGSNDAPKASVLQLTGTATSVDLDPSTMAVLQQNGVSVAPVAPATVSTAGGTTTVSFPISEGYVSVYDSPRRRSSAARSPTWAASPSAPGASPSPLPTSS